MENVEQSNQQDLNEARSLDSTLGTFRNVQALRDAYDNLRSEFTRKSQLLATYQRQSEMDDKVDNANQMSVKIPSQNESADLADAKNEGNTMHIDNKNNDKNSQNNAQKDQNQSNMQSTMQLPFWERDDWDYQIKSFFDQFPMDTASKKELAKILSEDKDLEYSQSPLVLGYAKMLHNHKNDFDKNLNDESFVKSHILSNPLIRQVVINDYLTQLNKDRVTSPQLIAKSSGVQAVAETTKKPMTLGEANQLVKKFFE